jgi:hypothetical protein
MKRPFTLLSVFVLFLMVSSALLAADYDQKLVKQSMRDIQAALSGAQASFAAKDYFDVAVKFMDMAKLLKAINDMVPPKGTPADWVSLQNKLINSLLKGIGACAEKDDKAIQKTLDDAVAIRGQGHKEFR